MSVRLQLARDLTLPRDIATAVIGIIAQRRVGKTYTASVLAEEFLEARQPIAVIDPTDAWYGLKSSPDGKHEAYPIAVFGGPHGDVDLLETSGKLLADLAVDEHVPMVLSVRHLSRAGQRRLVADFCERLFDRKGEPGKQDPLHLLIDEADAFVPQRPVPGGERTYGAVDQVVRRGGSSGLGVTLITQRPAVIAKDVLTQIDLLITLRVVSPQDQKALKAWIETHDALGQAPEYLQSLAMLPRGRAWFWSPGLLDLFRQVDVRERRTFNSSATPKVGQKLIVPKKLAQPDLARIKSAMAATLEAAKANDPTALKARVRELEQKLAGEQQMAPPAPAVKRVDVPILPPKDAAHLERAATQMKVAGDSMLLAATQLTEHGMELVKQAGALMGRLEAARRSPEPPSPGPRTPPPAPVQSRSTLPRPARTAVSTNGDGALKKCDRAVLAVLFQHPEGCTIRKLAIVSGYRISGGFKNALSTLRNAGYMTGENRAVMCITDEGRVAAGNVAPLPTGSELATHWLSQGGLKACERTVLQALLDHRAGLDMESLCAKTNYQLSGGFKNALATLRTIGVMTGRNNETMRAVDDLFD